jgi:HSP20 family protein
MRGSRWQSFGSAWAPLQELQGELNRLFDRWAGTGASHSTPAGYPAVNIWEEGDHLHLEAELPGLQLDELEISITGGNQLTLQGQTRPPAVEKGTWHRRERQYGNFARTVELPFPVDPEKVEARFEHGVLKVTLAKHESARPRKIVVKAE